MFRSRDFDHVLRSNKRETRRGLTEDHASQVNAVENIQMYSGTCEREVDFARLREKFEVKQI